MICQSGSGQVVGFVIDVFCTGMINVANEFNVPIYVFFTSNAAFLGFILHLKTLCDDQNQDVIELTNSDTMITIPSFVKPVPTKVVGFVIDVFCTGMINVANEFNVPIYVFFTSNAAFLRFILHLKTLCDDQNQDVIELSNSDTMITIPSF
nr:anthocyanidin 3-O-glucosyltransferase 2-like [Tanacetum cinerariifolium]